MQLNGTHLSVTDVFRSCLQKGCVCLCSITVIWIWFSLPVLDLVNVFAAFLLMFSLCQHQFINQILWYVFTVV